MINKRTFRPELAEKIFYVMLDGEARRWPAQQIVDTYSPMLPPYVKLVDSPNNGVNCAGFALDLGRSTSSPMLFLEEAPLKQATIYVLFQGPNEEDWVHVGKVIRTKEGKPWGLSKWGWIYPVYSHPIWFYPSRFQHIKFYVKHS